MTIEYKNSIEEIFTNGGYRVKNPFDHNVVDKSMVDLTVNLSSENVVLGGNELQLNRFMDLVVPIGLIHNNEYIKKTKISENSMDKIIGGDLFDKLFYSVSYKNSNKEKRITKKNRVKI